VAPTSSAECSARNIATRIQDFTTWRGGIYVRSVAATSARPPGAHHDFFYHPRVPNFFEEEEYFVFLIFFRDSFLLHSKSGERFARSGGAERGQNIFRASERASELWRKKRPPFRARFAAPPRDRFLPKRQRSASLSLPLPHTSLSRALQTPGTFLLTSARACTWRDSRPPSWKAMYSRDSTHTLRETQRLWTTTATYLKAWTCLGG
jgi:hypothetical protein